jgi:hypothetical protein
MKKLLLLGLLISGFTYGQNENVRLYLVGNANMGYPLTIKMDTITNSEYTPAFSNFMSNKASFVGGELINGVDTTNIIELKFNRINGDSQFTVVGEDR